MMPLKDIHKAKYDVSNKRLPPNFHEGVLELELLIENDKFDIKTIEQLLFLYSAKIISFELRKNNSQIIDVKKLNWACLNM